MESEIILSQWNEQLIKADSLAKWTLENLKDSYFLFIQ